MTGCQWQGDVPGAGLHQQQALPAHGTRAGCDALRGFRGSPQGSFAGYHFDFSSNTWSPGQPRQESTSCTSLRAASAGYCMDQHRWLSWKRLLALAPRRRYLGLGGGRNGRLGEK